MKLTRAQIEREVLYTRSFFGSGDFVPTESAAAIEERCAELIHSFEVVTKAVEPLRPGDHAIVTLTRRRTAALLADRVWGADTLADPAINFGWELPLEVRLRAMLRLQGYFERSPSAPRVPGTSQAEAESFLADVERDLASALLRPAGLRSLLSTVLPPGGTSSIAGVTKRPSSASSTNSRSLTRIRCRGNKS